MDLDLLRVLLGIIVVAALSYFLVRDPSQQAAPGRDLDREHLLGAHRQTPAWGCRACRSEGGKR